MKKMLMMELKKIRTEKYIMSEYWPAIRDRSMKMKGAANRDCLFCIPSDHATIFTGLPPMIGLGYDKGHWIGQWREKAL